MARSTNQLVNPNAREAMNRFKMETASELGVNLKQGYNGDITARQAGSIGGQMVKKICPVRRVKFERTNRVVSNHKAVVLYAAGLVL
ncbi:MAG: alpha/beta-type small acid-soluble spore protein [Oscillospiraceae bacterium]|nr:alpha/beta-type small acid-soluble spore protein [Oscillospiraceae bacterium]